MILDADRLAQEAGAAGLVDPSLVVLPLDFAAAPVVCAPDAALYPASMIKVPLVAVALAEVGAGRLGGLESTVTIGPENMTANDAASPMVAGYAPGLLELMTAAIARSDNVATNVLFDLVGRERATEVARDRFGLKQTVFARKLSGSEPLIEDPDWDGYTRNAHPASDAASLFRAIAENAVPHANLLREMLAAQFWNDKLSKGLDAGDRFDHKTGETSEVNHDGGILTTAQGKRYVVVAYTGEGASPESDARMAAFMRAIRPLL